MSLEGKQCLNVPGYSRPITFGTMSTFFYQIDNSGIIVTNLFLITMMMMINNEFNIYIISYAKYILNFSSH